MPAYELSVLLKVLPRSDIAATLKRVGTLLLDKGAIIKKLENHGTKELPFQMIQAETIHTNGSYYVFSFIASPKIFGEMNEVFRRDIDILRHGVADEYKDLKEGCTLEEELQPPALRKSVLNLMEASKKNKGKAKPYYKHLREHNYFDIYM